MIVNITVEGDAALIGRLLAMPPVVQRALEIKVKTLALKLEALVKTGKLNGQVLNRVTGALSRSIHHKVDVLANGVIGRVFSSGDVKYAGIHEFGFRGVVDVKAHVRSMAFGKETQPFTVGAYQRQVNAPERSFLRSSLHDMSVEISTGMKTAVVEAVMRQVKGTK